MDGPTMQTLAPVFASVQETETRHRVVTAANHYQIRVLEWFPNNQQIPISAGGDPGLGPKTSHSGAVRPGAEPPTVVFLHGFLGGPRDWAAVASALALGCRCLAVELPGHGDSCGATLHGTGGPQCPKLSPCTEALKCLRGRCRIQGLGIDRPRNSPLCMTICWTAVLCYADRSLRTPLPVCWIQCLPACMQRTVAPAVCCGHTASRPWRTP